jgi:Nif-specific ferredoxin III
MDNITGMTRGGTEWVPQFVVSLNEENCIGCGRCFKVCPRDVFELVEREAADDLDDDDDDFSDDTSMVMSIANAMDCIGCQSCSRVCPKDCHSHSALPLSA